MRTQDGTAAESWFSVFVLSPKSPGIDSWPSPVSLVGAVCVGRGVRGGSRLYHGGGRTARPALAHPQRGLLAASRTSVLGSWPPSPVLEPGRRYRASRTRGADPTRRSTAGSRPPTIRGRLVRLQDDQSSGVCVWLSWSGRLRCAGFASRWKAAVRTPSSPHPAE